MMQHSHVRRAWVSFGMVGFFFYFVRVVKHYNNIFLVLSTSKKKRSPRLASGALPLPMARVRRTRVSAPRGTAAATGASPGAAVDNTSTVPAVPQSSKLSALSDFLLPELVALRLCAQRADSAARVAEQRGAARTPDCSSA